MIHRRAVTNHILASLNAELDKPVGDMEAPDGGGWQGEMNKSSFVPYVVLTPGNSSNMESAMQGDDTVVFTYSISSFGVSRDQSEWMSDLALDAAKLVTRSVVDNAKILVVEVSSYGSVNRSDQTDPPFFSRTDSIDVFTTPA